MSLQGVWKRFNQNVVAVRDANLEIYDGEFLVLVGPSGCGKTTLLRMLAGLETISEGEIWIGDRLINKVRPADRDIAMVFQSYALYPHMNVVQNMSFGLRLRKMAEQVIGQRVQGTAGVLSVQQLLERRPHQLSGGQRQRVALGRAMVREPAVFLMDEPLSNLDAKLRVQTRAELSRLHQRLRTTTVYVTHDQAEAMTLGSRVVVMREGVIQQVGTPEEIYRRPANRFVAGFVGTPAMNFGEGTVVQAGGGLAVAMDHLELPLDGGVAERAADRVGQRVTVGIRPEDAFDPRYRVADARLQHVAGAVELREAMGPENFLHVRIGNHLLVSRVDSRCGARVGDQVELAVDLSKVHLFDPATEVAIA